MINWTDEMLGELKAIEGKQIKDFAEKWGMSTKTAKVKKLSLVEAGTSHIETDQQLVETVDLEEKLQEVNASTLHIIPSVILDMDKLISNGVRFYLVEVCKEISVIDKTISDYSHTLENQFDTMTETGLSDIAKKLGLLRRKRRVYKNEHEFLDNNRVDCDAFVKFVKQLKDHSLKLDNRVYRTRVLKEELGSCVITNPNNAELETMRDKVGELTAYSDNLAERNLKLERFRVKQERANKRAKGEKPLIDLLATNWTALFNEMEDSITKKGILTDCYNQCKQDKGITHKETLDYLVFQEYLPLKMVELGYFPRKTQ